MVCLRSRMCVSACCTAGGLGGGALSLTCCRRLIRAARCRLRPEYSREHLFWDCGLLRAPPSYGGGREHREQLPPLSQLLRCAPGCSRLLGAVADRPESSSISPSRNVPVDRSRTRSHVPLRGARARASSPS